MSKKIRVKSFFALGGIYLLAAAVGFLTYMILPYAMWINLLVADLAATAVIFIFSMILDNSSIFDPFWAMAPVVVLTAVATRHPLSWAGVLVMLTVAMWSLRYVTNGVYSFRDIHQESQENTLIHKKVGDGYPIISLFGLHLMPAVVTYACTLPATFIIESGIAKPNVAYVIFLVIAVAAIALQAIADCQKQIFKYFKKEGFIQSGFWKYSRHPGLMSEIFVWWGIALAGISLLGFEWHLILGAILSTLFLTLFKAALAEWVSKQQEGYEEYKNNVPRFLFVRAKQGEQLPEPSEEDVEEVIIIDNDVKDEDLVEAMAVPEIALADIDYDDDDDGTLFVATDDNPGIEVVGVVWPERRRHNKIYKYDPNGEKLKDGDIVLVPSRDVARGRDIVRKATVAHGNYMIDGEMIHKPLKKIIAIVKHTTE